MPTFEFVVAENVKVDAPDRLIAARALEYERPAMLRTVDLGQLGKATIAYDGKPRITAKRERKAKKAFLPPPELLTGPGRKAPPEEPPRQTEVKDACYKCGQYILPGQPFQEIQDGPDTRFVHSVCAAAGGAT